MSWRSHPIITQVLPYLYLGGSNYSLEDLKQRQIRHVLTVCYDPKELETDESHPLNILHLAVDDFPDDNIKLHFGMAFQFIENALLKKEAVLIHCHAGMSRSPTITIAYILHKATNHPQQLIGIVCNDGYELEQSPKSGNLEGEAKNHFDAMVKEPTLKNVFGFVKTRRCIIEPNNGFMKQLIAFEKELLGAISADPVLFDDEIWGEGCKKLYDQYLEGLFPSDNNCNNCAGDEPSAGNSCGSQPQHSLGNQ